MYFRIGATERSFPATFSSSCHHEVLSAPANHKRYGGPGGRQYTSECGKQVQRGDVNTELYCGVSPSVTLTFKSECLPLSQLDQMCLDKRPALDDVTATDSQKQNIQAILDLLEQSGQVKSTPVLTALHLIISAMDGEKVVLSLKCCFNLNLLKRSS